jgi:hypothetical protein
LLDFKRSTIQSEYKIGRIVKYINNKINERNFWEFNYYNNPEEKIKKNTNVQNNYLYFLWEKYIKLKGGNSKILVPNGSKINNTKVFTTKPILFGRDILRPQFHVGFSSPLNQKTLNKNLEKPYQGLNYGKEGEKRQDLRFYNDRLQDLNLQNDIETPKGPYAGFYSNRVQLEFYFTFSNTYFFNPFKVDYKGLVVNRNDSGPFQKHSGIRKSLDSYGATTRNYSYFYNVDGENYNERSRVKYPFTIRGTSMGGSSGYISQDMSIHDLKERDSHRPLTISNSTSRLGGKYVGLSKQETDVEIITSGYYKVFNAMLGNDLVKQIQAPPMDDGLFISRVKTGTQLEELTVTPNYLYALAQQVVQSRYYYDPATDKPDLSYLSVEIIPEIK